MFNYRRYFGTFARPENANANLPAQAEAAFASTLEVTGLLLKDSAGNAGVFQVQADSGAVYSSRRSP